MNAILNVYARVNVVLTPQLWSLMQSYFSVVVHWNLCWSNVFSKFLGKICIFSPSRALEFTSQH